MFYEDFCKTLASYKGKISAGIFEEILDKFDNLNKWDREYFGYAIYHAIDEYPDPAYKKIRSKVISLCQIDTIKKGVQVFLGKEKKTGKKPPYLWALFTHIPIE